VRRGGGLFVWWSWNLYLTRKRTSVWFPASPCQQTGPELEPQLKGRQTGALPVIILDLFAECSSSRLSSEPIPDYSVLPGPLMIHAERIRAFDVWQMEKHQHTLQWSPFQDASCGGLLKRKSLRLHAAGGAAQHQKAQGFAFRHCATTRAGHGPIAYLPPSVITMGAFASALCRKHPSTWLTTRRTFNLVIPPNILTSESAKSDCHFRHQEVQSPSPSSVRTGRRQIFKMPAPRRRKFESCENDQPAKRPCRRPAWALDDGGHDGASADTGDGGAHSSSCTGSRTLACPYYKSFPTQFTRCLFRNQLTSTSFVLQHLNRCHMRPIQCPICNQSFDKANERDQHLRQQTCRPEAGPIQGSLADNGWEGIDAHQLALLRGRPKRGLTEAERWYAIWNVLFPHTPRPDSPYITSPEDEILHIARRAMKLLYPRGTTSSQLLNRLDWSTVSSALENNQSADHPPNETDSFSYVDLRTPQQPGDVEPWSTTVMSNVSTQAGSEESRSSSNSTPALHSETPTTSSLGFEPLTLCNTQGEEPFAHMPPDEAQYCDEVQSDGFQMQRETAEPKEWFEFLWPLTSLTTTAPSFTTDSR
jgi:hypothetical protein